MEVYLRGGFLFNFNVFGQKVKPIMELLTGRYWERIRIYLNKLAEHDIKGGVGRGQLWMGNEHQTTSTSQDALADEPQSTKRTRSPNEKIIRIYNLWITHVEQQNDVGLAWNRKWCVSGFSLNGKFF